MPVIPVPLTDAIPLMEADGVTGRNNAHDFRIGLLATLFLSRTGIIPRTWDDGWTSLAVTAQTTASASLDVAPGAFISIRANQGPYIGFLDVATTITTSPADAINPRIDVLYAAIGDPATIPSDSTVGAYLGIVEGIPAAEPQTPTVLPDGATPLVQLARPAGTTTITAAQVADLYQASGTASAPRPLMAGDSLMGKGLFPGEKRYRQADAGLPELEDYWDGTTWRGTRELFYVGAGLSNAVTLSGSPQTVAIIDIPDPGWPYKVVASATVEMAQPSGTRWDLVCRIDGPSGPGTSGIAACGSNQQWTTPAGQSPELTGRHTVHMTALKVAGGNGTITKYNNYFTARVIPT
jgi:hypothetical protein